MQWIVSKGGERGNYAIWTVNASFEIEFNGDFKLQFTDSKVHKSFSNLIIWGAQGLVDNEVETRIFRTGNSKQMQVFVKRKDLRHVWKNTSVAGLRDTSVLLTEAPVDRTPTMHTHIFDNSVILDEHPSRAYDPDGTRAWARELEGRHAKLRNVNTVDDCVVDPDNNVLTPENNVAIRKICVQS